MKYLLYLNCNEKILQMTIHNYDYFLGSSTFMLGCICFTVDAIKQRPISKPLVTGCLLFDVGCIFFIKDSLT